MKRLALLAPLAFAVAASAQVILIPQQVIVQQPIIGQVTAGTTLTVHAAVTPDHRYVGMNINIHQETLDGFDTIIYGTQGVGAGNIAPGVIQLPRTGTLDVNTRVFAPDGGGASLGVSGENAAAFFASPIDRGAVARSALGEDVEPIVRTNKITVLAENDRLLARENKAFKGEMSLQEVVKKIAADSQVNIHLAVNLLTKSHVDITTKRAFDIPAGPVERQLVFALAQGVKDTPMAIKADGDVVTVTTRDGVDTRLVQRNYSLERIKAYLTHLDPKEKAFTTISTQDAPTASPESVAAQGVMKLIRPEVWKSHGGKSQVFQSGDIISIIAPASVHAELPIEELTAPTDAPKDYRYQDYGTQ